MAIAEKILIMEGEKCFHISPRITIARLPFTTTGVLALCRSDEVDDRHLAEAKVIYRSST